MSGGVEERKRKEGKEEGESGGDARLGIELPQVLLPNLNFNETNLGRMKRIGRRNSAIGVRQSESDHRTVAKRQASLQNTATFTSPVSACSFTVHRNPVLPHYEFILDRTGSITRRFACRSSSPSRRPGRSPTPASLRPPPASSPHHSLRRLRLPPVWQGIPFPSHAHRS